MSAAVDSPIVTPAAPVAPIELPAPVEVAPAAPSAESAVVAETPLEKSTEATAASASTTDKDTAPPALKRSPFSDLKNRLFAPKVSCSLPRCSFPFLFAGWDAVRYGAQDGLVKGGRELDLSGNDSEPLGLDVGSYRSSTPLLPRVHSPTSHSRLHAKIALETARRQARWVSQLRRSRTLPFESSLPVLLCSPTTASAKLSLFGIHSEF